VLEFPWKLIRLGPTEQLLFNVTTPDGETKNLIAQHPEIAERLGKAQNLERHPEAPRPAYGNRRRGPVLRRAMGYCPVIPPPRPPDLKAGWSEMANSPQTTARCKLSPEPSAPFLTRNFLPSLARSLPLSACGQRTARNSALHLAHEPRTISSQMTQPGFVWPTSSEWQKVKAVLPVKGTLHPPALTMPPEGTCRPRSPDPVGSKARTANRKSGGFNDPARLKFSGTDTLLAQPAHRQAHSPSTQRKWWHRPPRQHPASPERFWA